MRGDLVVAGCVHARQAICDPAVLNVHPRADLGVASGIPAQGQSACRQDPVEAAAAVPVVLEISDNEIPSPSRQPQLFDLAHQDLAPTTTDNNGQLRRYGPPPTLAAHRGRRISWPGRVEPRELPLQGNGHPTRPQSSGDHDQPGADQQGRTHRDRITQAPPT